VSIAASAGERGAESGREPTVDADQDAPRECSSPVARAPLSREDANRLARMFKVLGDPVRLRLLSLIAGRVDGEACVCELAGDRFAVAGPTISHHLRVLREAGLVAGERRGTWVYYRLLPGTLDALAAFLAAARPARG